MRTFTLNIRKKIGLLMAGTLITAMSYAATFTAVASGNFSSSATWGGTAPSSSILLDQIVIPAGITVNLDNDVNINGLLSSVDVEGTLTASGNSALTLTLGTLSGAGTIMVNSLELSAGSTFSFTGALTTNTLMVAQNVSTSADIMVMQTATLTSGTLSLVSGGSLDLGSNGTIEISGGLLSLGGGGSTGLTGNYNVTYTSGSSVAGVELSGSGLQNVTVDVSAANQVTLTSDLTVGGTLTLTSGSLNLSGNNLTVNGSISAAGSGTINSTSLSNININTNGGTGGTIHFGALSHSANNVTINVGAGSQAYIAGALNVTGNLNLTSGTLNFSGTDLNISGDITGSGTLTGNSTSNLTINTLSSLSSSLNFSSGGQTVNDLSITVGSGNSANLASSLTVMGDLSIAAGSQFDISDNSLTLSGDINGMGSIMTNQGSAITVTSTSGLTGNLHLAGSSVGTLIINTGNSGSVSLGADATVSGSLSLQNGTLNLNGNNLTITGNVMAGGSGSITTTSASNISINSTASLTGALNFSGSGNAVNNLTVNVGSGNQASISGELSVDGTLQLTSGNLNFSNASLTVNGNVSGTGMFSGNSSSNLTINSASSLATALTFAANNQIVNNLTVNTGSGNSATLGSALRVDGTLALMGGSDLNIGSNTLALGAGSSISGSGSLVTTTTSNIIVNATGGILLDVSANLGSLTINSGSGSVTLAGDINVNGTLNMQSGTMVLNSNDLTISGNIAANGTGTISTTSSSNITVSTNATTSGSLGFTSGSNTVGDLTINIGGNGSVALGTDVEVNGTLHFMSGSINAGNNGVIVATSGSISGASSTSYVMTDATGYLQLHVTGSGSGTGTVMFPVGTSSNYAPANIHLGGTSSSDVQVGVMGDVLSQGTTGSSITGSGQAAVNATWNVHASNTTNLNLDLQVMWSTALEANGFNHTSAYISHYTGGQWDATATTGATAEGNGMFSITRTGITSLSPFSVFDNSTTVGIEDVVSNVTFEVFPNPVVSNLTIKNTNATTDVMNADIYTATGQLISTHKLTDATTTISFEEFTAGTYFVKVYNSNSTVTKTITKL